MALSDEPLLPQQQQNGQPPVDDEVGCGCRRVTCITALGTVFFIFTWVVDVYCSQGNRVTMSSAADLLALLACLNSYEKAEPGSELRDRQKVFIWMLMMMLAFIFSCQVATVVSPAVAVVVGLTAVGTAAGLLYHYI